MKIALVALIAAALVAFPLPPRQLGDAAEAGPIKACDSCPPPAPKRDELAVADQAGSRIAAFWLRREGERLSGTLRVLDSEAKPVEVPVSVQGAEPASSCGTGCRDFVLPAASTRVAAVVEEKGKRYRASVPAIWQETASSRAKTLLARAERTMQGLRSVKEDERLTSGPGTSLRTLYRLKAPDRLSYETSSGTRSVVIGKRQWTRTRGRPWHAQPFGSGPFRTKDFFNWTLYAHGARLLSVHGGPGARVADVALMDAATPVWFRLQIELSTRRVLKDRMITNAHFMDRRYFALNETGEIESPSGSASNP